MAKSTGAIPPDGLWSLLTTEHGAGVCVLSRFGAVLYLNDACAQIFFGKNAAAEDIQGRYIPQLYTDEAFVTERMALIRMVLRQGEPLVFRAFHRGRQHYSWITPFDDRVLVVTRRIGAGRDEDLAAFGEYRRIDSAVVGLGPLTELTGRELAVLALLGDGMTTAEAADRLGVGVNTVRAHRRRISDALDIPSRPKLVRHIQRIGFTLADAEAAAD